MTSKTIKLIREGKISEANQLLIAALYLDVTEYIKEKTQEKDDTKVTLIFYETLKAAVSKIETENYDYVSEKEFIKWFKNICFQKCKKYSAVGFIPSIGEIKKKGHDFTHEVEQNLRKKQASDFLFENGIPYEFYLNAFQKMDNTKCQTLILLHNIFKVDHKSISEKVNILFPIKNERSSISQLSDCMKKLTKLAKAFFTKSKLKRI